MAKKDSGSGSLVDLMMTRSLFTMGEHEYRAIELRDFLTVGCLGGKPYTVIRKQYGHTFLYGGGELPLDNIAMAELDSNGDKRYVYAFPVLLRDKMYCLLYGKLTDKPNCVPTLISVGGVSVFSRNFDPAMSAHEFAMDCIDGLIEGDADCVWTISDGVGYGNVTDGDADLIRLECVNVFQVIFSAFNDDAEFGTKMRSTPLPSGLRISRLDDIKGELEMRDTNGSIGVPYLEDLDKTLTSYAGLLGVKINIMRMKDSVILYVRLSELVNKVKENLEDGDYISLEALYPDQRAIGVKAQLNSSVVKLYMMLYEFTHPTDVVRRASLGCLSISNDDIPGVIYVIDDTADGDIRTCDVNTGGGDADLLQDYAEAALDFTFSRVPVKRAEYPIPTEALSIFEDILAAKILGEFDMTHDDVSDIDGMGVASDNVQSYPIIDKDVSTSYGILVHNSLEGANMAREAYDPSFFGSDFIHVCRRADGTFFRYVIFTELMGHIFKYTNAKEHIKIKAGYTAEFVLMYTIDAIPGVIPTSRLYMTDMSKHIEGASSIMGILCIPGLLDSLAVTHTSPSVIYPPSFDGNIMTILAINKILFENRDIKTASDFKTHDSSYPIGHDIGILKELYNFINAPEKLEVGVKTELHDSGDIISPNISHHLAHDRNPDATDVISDVFIAITERELKEKHEAEKAELNRVTSVILSNAMPLSDAVLPRDTSMLKFMMCVARVNRVVNFYFVTKELDIHVLSAIPTKELNETPNSQYIQAVAYIMNQTFKLRNIDHSNDIADAGTLSTFESLNEMAYNPNFRFERRDIKTGIYAKQSIIKVDDLIMGFIDNLDIGSDRFYLNPIKWLEAASISVDNKSFAKTVINYSGDKTIKDISISTSSISPNYKLWVTMEKKIVMRPNDAGAIQYISGDYDRQLKAKPNLGAMFNALELASAKGGDGLKW